MKKNFKPEFSRPFAVEELRDQAKERIEATDTERSALARRLAVDGVNSVSADFCLTREMGAIIRLTGSISATIVQSCVVTLRPVESGLRIDVNCRFGPQELVDDADECDLSMDEDDPPDLIAGGEIDLGEVAAEMLALEIDPFPRANGAEFEGYQSAGDLSEKQQSPFAVLKEVVKKPK